MFQLNLYCSVAGYVVEYSDPSPVDVICSETNVKLQLCFKIIPNIGSRCFIVMNVFKSGGLLCLFVHTCFGVRINELFTKCGPQNSIYCLHVCMYRYTCLYIMNELQLKRLWYRFALHVTLLCMSIRVNTGMWHERRSRGKCRRSLLFWTQSKFCSSK